MEADWQTARDKERWVILDGRWRCLFSLLIHLGFLCSAIEVFGFAYRFFHSSTYSRALPHT